MGCPRQLVGHYGKQDGGLNACSDPLGQFLGSDIEPLLRHLHFELVVWTNHQLHLCIAIHLVDEWNEATLQTNSI